LNLFVAVARQSVMSDCQLRVAVSSMPRYRYEAEGESHGTQTGLVCDD